MSRAISIVVVLLCCGLCSASVSATCKKASETQQCLGCANQVVELEQTKIGPKVRGTIHLGMGSEPSEGVLVEVFSRPDGAVPLWNPETAAQRTRADACVVGKDGQFSFHLKPGKYELRFSLSSGWNCTYLKIEVERGLRTKKLRIPLKIGT